uniref:Uncharacterized protein n=1 Tax=Pipistrellus kuhlii TaxID=59472 RepID=A0A7J8B114_PIPKU|nr:hypothetical protein mPipKuh1_007706 [Pipistrellus kuhlii]
MPPPGVGAAGASQGPDRWPRLLSWGPNPHRAVPEGAPPPPPPRASCRGSVGHSSEPSDASYKNNNLLAGVRSREEATDRAPQRMLGLVVSPPALHRAAAEGRTTTPEEQRSPRRGDGRKPRASQHPVRALRRRRGAAEGCYGDGYYNRSKGFMVSALRTARDFDR